MPTERHRVFANRAGWVFAGGVVVLGSLVVVAPAARHLNLSDPYSPNRTQRTTVERIDAAGKKSVETTVAERPKPLLELALAQGGLLILRIGVVALAAFLAGAVAQRAVLADFAIKVGGLEVPALPEVADNVAKVTQGLATRLSELEQTVDEDRAATAQALEDLGTQVLMNG